MTMASTATRRMPKASEPTSGKAKYKRIVLKLSGEALQGKLGFGIEQYLDVIGKKS